MPSIAREGLRHPKAPRVEKHPLPECGEGAYVHLRALGSQTLLRLQGQYGQAADTDNTDFVYDLLASCLVDGDGIPLFDDAQDAQATINLSLPALKELVKDCLAVSGIEVAEKN